MKIKMDKLAKEYLADCTAICHVPTERAHTSAIALREMGLRDPWREIVINHSR